MQVFVCYPSEHEKEAREVRTFIRSVGLDTWFDKDNLIGGDDWNRERQLALAKAHLVAVLCAEQTTARNGVYQREINEALEHAKDRRLGARYILPVRLAEVALPPELERIQFIDYYRPNWRRAFAIALKAAVEEAGETIPDALQVAAAEPDEGGIRERANHETRPQGTLEIDWFTYTLEGEYWDYINSLISERALGDFFKGRRQLDEWTHTLDGVGGSYIALVASEFYRKGQLVSLVFGFSDYFAGAAHPNHGVHTLNVFGESAGVIPVEDLFNYEAEPLDYLTAYANQDIRRQAESAGDARDISSYVKDWGWDIFRQFSFNSEGIQWNFTSASGFPHVLGHTEVYMPWRHAERILAPLPKKLFLEG